MIHQKLFVRAGDKFTSKSENYHFHRGHKYEVSKCFDVGGNIAIFMKDKHGFDVPYKVGEFETTAATQRAIDDRCFHARLRFFWETRNDMRLMLGGQHCAENTRWFVLNKAHFIGEGLEDVIASVERWKRIPGKDDGVGDERQTKHFEDKDQRKYIKKPEEFYKHFEGLRDSLGDWPYTFTLSGVNADTQIAIDFARFMADENLPRFTEASVNPPKEIKIYSQRTLLYESTFEQLMSGLSEIIFDKPAINDPGEIALVWDILTLFRELPSSHGPTSIASILTGKSKIKNSKADPYMGKYANRMKYDQVFELASMLEGFMFAKNVFMTKEEYSSGTEWRGSFEFIGSKYVNNTMLAEYQDFLMALSNRL